MKKFLLFLLLFIILGSIGAGIGLMYLNNSETETEIVNKEILAMKEEDDLSRLPVPKRLEYIHDMILDKVVYDDEAARSVEKLEFKIIPDMYKTSYTIDGAWTTGKGTCTAYADLFVHISALYGLEVGKVTGLLDGVPHAWNYFEMAGNVYYFDLTQNSMKNPEKVVFFTVAEDMEDYYLLDPPHVWRNADRLYDYYYSSTAYDLEDAINIAEYKMQNGKPVVIRLAFTHVEEDINAILKATKQYKSSVEMKYGIFANALVITFADE